MNNKDEDYEFKKDVAYMELKKFKEKTKDMESEDFSKELFLEWLTVSYNAAQFPELVDFVRKKEKYGLD